ncbi:MAG: hypothetical protein ACLTD7_10815, partial [Clostridia bacterium]
HRTGTKSTDFFGRSEYFSAAFACAGNFYSLFTAAQFLSGWLYKAFQEVDGILQIVRTKDSYGVSNFKKTVRLRHGCVKTVVTEVAMSFRNAHRLRALWHR